MDSARSSKRSAPDRPTPVRARTLKEALQRARERFGPEVRIRESRTVTLRQEDQLGFVEQQLELGRATRSDVLRSQVDLNNARVALLNAENSARNSGYALAEAVGVSEPLAPVETAELEAERLPFDSNEILSMALAGAPSLVSARATAAAIGRHSSRSPRSRTSIPPAGSNSSRPTRPIRRANARTTAISKTAR